MITLARFHGQRPVPAGEIAGEQAISLKYLESILAVLKAARLVAVKRGNGGGYMLTRPPDRITLYDVLAPLEDFLGIVHCTDDDCDCERYPDCVTRGVWQELKDATEAILKKKTLASLVRQEQSKGRPRGAA
jgi:Rrf2 family protein